MQFKARKREGIWGQGRRKTDFSTANFKNQVFMIIYRKKDKRELVIIPTSFYFENSFLRLGDCCNGWPASPLPASALANPKVRVKRKGCIVQRNAPASTGSAPPLRSTQGLSPLLGSGKNDCAKINSQGLFGHHTGAQLSGSLH